MVPHSLFITSVSSNVFTSRSGTNLKQTWVDSEWEATTFESMATNSMSTMIAGSSSSLPPVKHSLAQHKPRSRSRTDHPERHETKQIMGTGPSGENSCQRRRCISRDTWKYRPAFPHIHRHPNIRRAACNLHWSHGLKGRRQRRVSCVSSVISKTVCMSAGHMFGSREVSPFPSIRSLPVFAAPFDRRGNFGRNGTCIHRRRKTRVRASTWVARYHERYVGGRMRLCQRERTHVFRVRYSKVAR